MGIGLFSFFRSSLRNVLVISFISLAILTIGLNTLVISRLISDYLIQAEDERVARDLRLAKSFYELKLDEVAAISHRLVLDRIIRENFDKALQGDSEALNIIDQQINNKILVLALGGTHAIVALDLKGGIVVGRVLHSNGTLSSMIHEGTFKGLPIFEHCIAGKNEIAATEVIPVEFLQQIGLDEQARIPMIETPFAAADPFDPRAGTAGLVLISVAPLRNSQNTIVGAFLSMYLFNNDFTLVDRIKSVAGIDTVTIFLGDFRVSTNVLNQDGSRAVGTRVSKAVYDQVLLKGLDYKGDAFVVNDWYITQYTPLRNHLGNIVGILYVGALRSEFDKLVRDFIVRVVIISLICILLAGIGAIPISRYISNPISKLVHAHRVLSSGDMSVRVEPTGPGDIHLLCESFNTMVEMLHSTQQELLHSEKLASMGQLAAGVAHEINNPLGTILLLSEVIQRETSPDDPHYKDLSLIISETQRSKRIVSDLLNFARQQEILKQKINIHEAIDQAIGAVTLQPIFQDVTIERNYDLNILPILADPSQLLQVFINLLMNAAEAMDGKGKITITTQKVDADWIELQFTDTGKGIPEENHSRIFTPFFTTKPPGVGTGLGLSIIYGIIKMHRGQITFRSKVGKGTTFIIRLPVR